MKVHEWQLAVSLKDIIFIQLLVELQSQVGSIYDSSYYYPHLQLCGVYPRHESFVRKQEKSDHRKKRQVRRHF